MGRNIYQPTAKDVREITGKSLLTVLQRRIKRDTFSMMKMIHVALNQNWQSLELHQGGCLQVSSGSPTWT